MPTIEQMKIIDNAVSVAMSKTEYRDQLRTATDLAEANPELGISIMRAFTEAYSSDANAPIPKGYHRIEIDGKKVLSEMTQWEYDCWQRGDKSSYSGFEIKPKRDFGEYGFYDPESERYVKEGWVVVRNGCLALPGATWSATQNQAMMMIHAFIAADENTDRFWALVRLANYAKGGIA